MASPRTSVPGLTKKFNSALTTLVLLLCGGPSTVPAFPAVSSCPAPCLCVDILFGQSFANCSQRRLTDVPQSFNGDFDTICLAYNRIDEIRDNDFSNSITVETLNLKHNVITKIHKKAFENLKELTTLDLSYNRITVLPSSLFQNNSKLENLFLRSNMLLATEPIVYSASLKKLDISSCVIYNLPHNAFVGVPNLNALHLNDNSLTSLTIDTVKALRNLRFITMEPTKSTCLPKSFQNVIQYFKHKSVNYFPRIICEIDYKRYINNGDNIGTVSEIHHENGRNERQSYYNYVGRCLFIIFVCVFIGGFFSVIIMYECLTRRDVKSHSNISNSTTQSPTMTPGNNEMMPWYKSLLFRVSHYPKAKKDTNVAQQCNQ
jgi:hypothetical protein